MTTKTPFRAGLGWLLFLLLPNPLSAQSDLTNQWISLSIPSTSGPVPAYVQVTPLRGFLGRPSHWTAHVHTAYLPRSGHAWNGVGLHWAGSAEGDRLILLDDCVLGVYYLSNLESLYVATSTNTYEPGLTNFSSVMQTQLALRTNSPQRFLGQPPYRVLVETLLGSPAFRDYLDTNDYGYTVFINKTHPSSFKGLTVEGTNAVVTLQISTNITARIAFNKSVIPVWATTNGVSIGPIPTNCVFYSEVITNRVVSRVVY